MYEVEIIGFLEFSKNIHSVPFNLVNSENYLFFIADESTVIYSVTQAHFFISSSILMKFGILNILFDVM